MTLKKTPTHAGTPQNRARDLGPTVPLQAVFLKFFKIFLKNTDKSPYSLFYDKEVPKVCRPSFSSSRYYQGFPSEFVANLQQRRQNHEKVTR